MSTIKYSFAEAKHFVKHFVNNELLNTPKKFISNKYKKRKKKTRFFLKSKMVARTCRIETMTRVIEIKPM